MQEQLRGENPAHDAGLTQRRRYEVCLTVQKNIMHILRESVMKGNFVVVAAFLSSTVHL
jgi:hypothetical protein